MVCVASNAPGTPFPLLYILSLTDVTVVPEFIPILGVYEIMVKSLSAGTIISVATVQL